MNISLVTPRNESQIKALEQVNEKIEDLVILVESGSEDAPKIAESYLNSCSNGTGSKFEALLLSCTSDDQKEVKERIKTILENMNAIVDETNKNEQEPENGII